LRRPIALPFAACEVLMATAPLVDKRRSGRPHRAGLLALLLLGGAALLHADDAAKRLPVPAKAAQARAEELIRDIFKDDLAAAKEPADKSKLAGYLLQQGKETKDDPAARYVL